MDENSLMEIQSKVYHISYEMSEILHELQIEKLQVKREIHVDEKNVCLMDGIYEQELMRLNGHDM
jgi:hypothetical protein